MLLLFLYTDSKSSRERELIFTREPGCWRQLNTGGLFLLLSTSVCTKSLTEPEAYWETGWIGLPVSLQQPVSKCQCWDDRHTPTHQTCLIFMCMCIMCMSVLACSDTWTQVCIWCLTSVWLVKGQRLMWGIFSPVYSTLFFKSIPELTYS